MTCTAARQEGRCSALWALHCAMHAALQAQSTASSRCSLRAARPSFVAMLGLTTLQLNSIEPTPCCHCRLEFDDLHRTGIYTWPYLHELGTHKLSRMRQYMRALRERGLSRDPPRLRPRRPPAGGQHQAAAGGQQPGPQPGQPQQAQQPQQP